MIYQELVCLTNIIDHAITFIIWRTTKNQQTKYFAQEQFLGTNKLSLWTTILRTRHLLEKLSKWPHVGELTRYQQCLPYLVKIEQIGKYLWRQHMTHTKEGTKFSDSDIDDFLTLAQLILYAKVRSYRR